MISVGWDTGLTNACTVLDVPPWDARPSFVSTRTIAIGHKVALAKPRRLKGKGKGGKEGREQTHETVIDDDDLIEFWGEARCVLEYIKATSAPPFVVTVERADKAIARHGFGSNMGTGIVRASWLGGEIASIARSIFGARNVWTVNEEKWRNALIGGAPRARDEKEDHVIARVLPSAISGWPESSNNHNRDSGGVAVFGARRYRMLQLRDGLNSIGKVTVA